MTIENAVRIFAGTMILLSLVLAWLVSMDWLFFTVFIGLNLFQSGFTGVCPAEMIFRKMGLKSGEGSCFDK